MAMKWRRRQLQLAQVCLIWEVHSPTQTLRMGSATIPPRSLCPEPQRYLNTYLLFLASLGSFCQENLPSNFQPWLTPKIEGFYNSSFMQFLGMEKARAIGTMGIPLISMVKSNLTAGF